jgi:hypothetical protein
MKNYNYADEIIKDDEYAAKNYSGKLHCGKTSSTARMRI